MDRTEEVRERLRAKHAARKANLATEPSLDVDMKTLNHITSSEAYTPTVVITILKFLARKYQLNYENQFCVISSKAQLNILLQKSKNFHERPMSIVYHGVGNHWVNFFISSSADDRVNVFSHDYHSNAITNDLKNVFITNLVPISVDFSCQINAFGSLGEVDQCDGHSCGPLSLKNVDIMIQNFKADNKGFHKNLESLTFAKLSEVLSIQTDFKLELVENSIHKILQDFKPDLHTINDLKNFIDFTLKTKEQLGEKVGNYIEVLQEEMRKQEMNPEYEFDYSAISKARNDVNANLKGFDKTIEQIKATIKNIMPEYNDGSTIYPDPTLSSDAESSKNSSTIDPEPTLGSDAENSKNSSNKEAGETIRDSMLKLNTALEKFTFIFEFLRGTVETEKLNNLLDILEIKFGIERRLIRDFLKVELGKKPVVVQKEDLEIPSTLNIDEIFKSLPLKKDKPLSLAQNNKSSSKSLEQLLAEIALGRDIGEEEKNSYSPVELVKYLEAKYSGNIKILEFKKKFHEIKCYSDVWKDKDVFAIREWADKMRNCKLTKNGNDPIIQETIAIMDRALELTSGGHTLRNPQIISLLEYVNTNENEGKLCQISTGEGKTIIIAVVASIKFLQGYVMDVLTSNSILATEGVDSTRMFYAVFGISVETNNIESETGHELKARLCYKADVVYGTISNFQFDYLRDTFEGCNTRAGRAFGYAILDEVDNLAIDNGSYIAKLAGPFPGMESLKYVYIKIWQELVKAEASVFKDFDQKIKEKAEEIKSLRDSGKLSEELAQTQFENFNFELYEKQIESIKSKILASNPTNIDLIPGHLKEYCESMLESWVDNAIYGKYQCHENVNYVIKEISGESCIIPVDYQNTGVTLKNTMWCSGLHQILQLKHNLQLTTESVTSSFISNIGYIKLYKNRIFGLTGTLGSEAERDLLSAAYNLTFAVIPKFQPKLILEYEGKVVRDSQWLNLVSIESFLLAVKGRSVLIICKTISDLKNFEKNIKSLLVLEGKSDIVKIKLYVDEDGSSVVAADVGPFEIIIATNIAGRGTHFNTTDELDINGGLHVMLTFLTCNKRVQDQAFGRTARQDRQGSAQMIIRESDLTELDLNIDFDNTEAVTMELILKRRDDLEKRRLEQIKNEKLAEIDFQDILFSKFSELYSEFKKKQIKKLGGLFVAEDLKEFWAFWLHQRDFKGKKLNEVEQTFNQFKKDAKNILGSGDIEGKIQFNPYYCIRQAEYFIRNSMFEEAKNCVDNAILLSGNFKPHFYSAHFKLFEIEIEMGRQMFERFRKAVAEVFFITVKKNEKYKEKAKEALQQTIMALESEISYMKDNFFNEEDDESKSSKDFRGIIVAQEHENLLVKHIRSRYVALSTYHQHGQSLLKQLGDSSKDDKDTKGLSINTRIPYLRKLDDKNPNEKDLKASLTDESIAELESVGLETIYALREVHDASSTVIDLAQLQIAGGLAALAAGMACPPILPFMGGIAGVLISEGVCDIVIELISKGEMGFDVVSYVKGKCISFGIALATMGITAIAKSTKILNEAVKACKGLAELLRKCPCLSKVCQKLANKLDKLANYFQKLKHASKLSKLRHLATPRVQLLKSTLVNIGAQTLQTTVMSVISEKIVTASLNEILAGLKPVIEREVRKSIEKDKNVTLKLKSIEQNSLADILNDIFNGPYGEIAGDVLQEISLGVLRHSKNWKGKIASVAIDSAISVTNIVKYVEHFRSKFLKVAAATSGNVNNSVLVLKEMTELIISQVSYKIFAQVMQLAGKYANTFVISPLMAKVCRGRKQSKKSETVDEQPTNFAEISEAYELLGIKPGASIEEVDKAYRKAAKIHHPDKGGDTKTMIKINQAYSLLENLHEESSSRHFNQSQSNEPMKLITSGVETPQATKYDNTSKPSHRGNISTISKKMKQHIIVRYEDKNEIREFGTQFKNNGKGALIVTYSPPKADTLGHYTIPAEVIAKLKGKGIEVTLQSTGANNCLYDALVPQINAQNNSNPISVQTLRDIAEKFSLANFKANALCKASGLLNNPKTRLLHIKAQQALLVGGTLKDARDLRDGYIEIIKSIVPSTVETVDVTLNYICESKQEAIIAIIEHSNAFYEFKRDPEMKCIDVANNDLASFLINCDQTSLTKTGKCKEEMVDKILAHSAKIKDKVNQKITLYEIKNFDDLASLNVNFNYDKNKAAPFAVRIPNGDTAVFGEDLYCMAAYRLDPKGGKPSFHVADSQYKGKGLGSIYNVLMALTDQKFKLDIKDMPEIFGRIIGESIRNKSTFVSACFALVKNLNSPLVGSDVDDLPVTARTGIIRDESGVLGFNNPDYLLSLHRDRCKYDDNIKDLLRNINSSLGNKNNNELQNEFYKHVYLLAKHLLGQGKHPFPNLDAKE